MSYVPRLVLAPRDAGAPPAPLPDTPGVHTWRNKHGGVVATGSSDGAVHWMHWPYLAAFRFSSDAPDVITAFPAPNAPIDILRDTYQRSVLPMALQALGYEALHASAVLMPAGVVGFFAASETGKSTIAYGLAERGYVQWADDSLLFEPGSRPLVTRRLPFDIRLRPESSAFFDARPTAAHSAPLAPRPELAPVAALCLLKRDELPADTPVLIARLDPVRAFAALIAHAHCFNPHDEARRSAMLRHYMGVTGAIPVFEVVFRPALDLMPRIVAALVETLGSLASPEVVSRST
jgi:hypothetical protein